MVRAVTLSALLVVGLSCVLPSSAVLAQPPYLDPLPIDPNLQEKTKGNRDAATAKSRIISGVSTFDAQAQADLRTYFEGYLFKSMTHPEKYGDIQDDVRKSTLNDLRNCATRSKELHDFLAGLVLTQMKPLVEQNHHPIVRVNAMLFIGELNAEERGTTSPAPTPLPAALPYLREQLKNPNQIDGVRVAALVGIQRHIEANWILEKRLADDVISGLTQDMVDLISAAPPAGRSPEAHAWLQGRAVDVLGGLCGWLPSEPAFQTLSTMLKAENPISLRCRAAYAVSRVKFADLSNADKANWAEITGNLAGLLADACKVETTFLDAEKQKLAAGTSAFGGAGMPGMGGMGGLGPPGEPGGMGGMGGLGPPGGMGGMGLGGGKGDEPDGGFGGMMSGMGGMGGLGGFGGLSSSAKLGGLPAYKVDGSRRRMLYELACVKAAIQGPTAEADVKGIKTLAQANQTADPMVQKLEQTIAELDKAINVAAKDVDLDAMLKTMRTRGQELELLRPVTEKPADASEVPGTADVPSGDVPSGDVPPGDVPAPGAPAPGAPAPGAPAPGNPAGGAPTNPPPPGGNPPPPGGNPPDPGGDVPPG